MAQKAFRVPDYHIAKKSECNAGRLLAFHLVFMSMLLHALWDKKTCHDALQLFDCLELLKISFNFDIYLSLCPL